MEDDPLSILLSSCVSDLPIKIMHNKSLGACTPMRNYFIYFKYAQVW